MKLLFTFGALLLAFAGVTAEGAHSSAAVQEPALGGLDGARAGYVLTTQALAVAPAARREAVEPAERVSEPEGAFGFARILLGLGVAAIVGATAWVWSRHARRRREGGRRRGP